MPPLLRGIEECAGIVSPLGEIVNPSINDLLEPIFIKYGMKLDHRCEKHSTRPEKNSIEMVCWNNPNDYQVFVYADSTLGLRDCNISHVVQVDLNMRYPESCAALENWLKETARRYDSLQAP